MSVHWHFVLVLSVSKSFLTSLLKHKTYNKFYIQQGKEKEKGEKERARKRERERKKRKEGEGGRKIA